MNSIKHKFTLDMHSSQSQISIPAMLGDTNRSLHINLSEGGTPYVIDTGCLAKISIKRPTGSRFEEFCEIRNNTTVVYNFSQNENTCVVQGIHDCDVTLYGSDGEIVASPRFSMVVSESVIRSDNIPLEDKDISTINAIIAEELQRQAAEESRVNAERERVASEEERLAVGRVALQAVEDAQAEAVKAEASAERAEVAEDRAEAAAESLNVELPQEWVDINKAYEAVGESGHKLMGGLIYKDFDGKIKVYPLSPAYGVRTDECGKKLASVAVYNTAQQLMVKPATDGRHTVSLRQLDEFFGGGSTSDLGEKAFSLRKLPPVDLTPNINNRKPYVFCRDSQNKFAPKYYGEVTDGDTLAERDAEGRLRAKAPDVSSGNIYNDFVVNVDYLNRQLKYFEAIVDSALASKCLRYALSSNTYEITSVEGDEMDVVIIPSTYNGLPVTSIGESAFNCCTKLTYISIPDSVTSIGDSAFSYCESLTSIIIPNSVTSIGDSAFNGCESLTSITIPNGVTRIGSFAFAGCSSLTSITIPNRVTSISNYAFHHCSSLTSITIPDSVTSIDSYAFDYCSNLKRIYVPWAEGAVAGAPWGAPSSTIIYNYKGV